MNAGDIFLGFDPGGDRKFGVALADGERVKAHTVSSVDDAISWAVDACGSRQPAAAGIDTLLHWATSRSGLRPCDIQLRKRYQAVESSVMAPNSLFGAMAIGGMALALRLRQVWPGIMLNEMHPKVLLHALWGQGYLTKDQGTVRAAVERFVAEARYVESRITGEHELDAALSAWATRKGSAEGWTDIVGAKDKLLRPAGDVHYLWPESLEYEIPLRPPTFVQGRR